MAEAAEAGLEAVLIEDEVEDEGKISDNNEDLNNNLDQEIDKKVSTIKEMLKGTISNERADIDENDPEEGGNGEASEEENKVAIVPLMMVGIEILYYYSTDIIFCTFLLSHSVV